MPLDESLRDPGMDKALRRIEAVQKSGASHLNLSQLKLNALPEAIGQLISLRSLDLDANQLSSLPPEIINLTNRRLQPLPDVA